MKMMLCMFCLTLSCQGMALTTIYDGVDSIASDKYVKFNLDQEKIKDEGSDNQSLPGLPAKSQLEAGKFNSYQLSECQKYPTPFFVIGADELSMAWLDAHRDQLKEVNAFGLITNIATESELKEMETLSPIHLIPSNVDALAQVIKAPSYPFFTNGCEVWQ